MTEEHRAGVQGRHYTPPAHIPPTPGVKKVAPDLFRHCAASHTDLYSGTAEALIASGLVTIDMLPGQPGMPRTSASFRPLGEQRVRGEDGCLETWWLVPGFMHVKRQLDGHFQVRLTVSRDEQRRREEDLRRRREEDLRRRREEDLARWGQKGQVVASDRAPPRAPATPSRASHLSLVWSAPN